MVGEDFVRMAYSSRAYIRSMSWRGLLPNRWFSRLSTDPRESEKTTTWGILAVVAHSIACLWPPFLPPGLMTRRSSGSFDGGHGRARRRNTMCYLGYSLTHPYRLPC